MLTLVFLVTVVVQVGVLPLLADDPVVPEIEFTVPEGFTIELVAGPPLVERPITAAFDDQGRLYVSDSSGSNDPIQQQLEEKTHRIIRLDDTDHDGIFDRSQVFAAGMMFPEGTMFYDGSLYVSAPPSIWKLTDEDGDGVADKREEWFQGKTLTGCANDLHGPYLGPDGFIYWCKGAFAEQAHDVNGNEWTTRAAYIARCRPDGTGFEPVMTGGMDNPVDVVFTPTGDRIFSSTFLVHPGGGHRDGLARALYGSVHGKRHGVLDGLPLTGELMPVLVHLGAAAPCGLERYDFDLWGSEYRDNIFTCQFNLRRVSRHVLRPDGASFTTEDHEFVSTDNVDFHPTDVLADADGSLLIVNTGGWYKLCCPTSQLWKPDVLGGIYRVRKVGTTAWNDPRGKCLDWSHLTPAKLWKLQEDPRPAIREHATREFAARRETIEMERFLIAMQELPIANVGESRQAALAHVWALGQINNTLSQSIIRGLLQHSNQEVRQVAVQVVSLHRDRRAFGQLTVMLTDDSPANRRMAAEALGRLGDTGAIPHLLDAAAKATDRAQQHSLTYALIELADAQRVQPGLASHEPQTRAVALVALDQIPGSVVQPKQVIPFLDSSDPVLKQTADWLIVRHPEWGAELAGWLGHRLATTATTENSNSESPAWQSMEHLLATFAGHPSVQSQMAHDLGQSDHPVAIRELVLRAMARAKPSPTPSPWLEAMTRLIDQRDPDLLAATISTVLAHSPLKEPPADLDRALLAVAENAQLPQETRIQALSIISARIPDLSPALFELLRKSFSDDVSVGLRSAAAHAISTAHLSSEQLTQVCELTKTAGPLELNELFGPFVHTNNDALGLELIAALTQSQALPALRVEILREKLDKYGPTVKQAVDELHALVNLDLESQRARITQLLPFMENGDVRRGHAVFYSSKAACSACHRLGYAGGITGPDLSRIGDIRTKQDLLESILFPSLSFVRSYESVVVATLDGRVVNGLVRDETSTDMVLFTGPNKEIRLRKDDIEEILPSKVSVMPAGLDKQLTVQELADLVVFLKDKGKK